ncbi:hypothetical protein JR316_0009108 [Psilocybe cubensis]|uniref:Uncharacterized protein n=2 Tax=Psilocybe cubensis TaxID=181762 RepID=A0ACB8GSV3_PSICU|nr:hypothetical protein JR316_0009108 [Psilocybe cubensis]KAH9478651.1 hypothetical protein JR316_0009108 [Psilocybe cubensis]
MRSDPKAPMEDLNFILIDRSGALVSEWTRAFTEHIQDRALRARFTPLTLHSGALADLDAAHKQFDCVVSPANSYGRLDGGKPLSRSPTMFRSEMTALLTRFSQPTFFYPILRFDQAISDALSPTDPHLPTQLAQSLLYDRWKGYAPPGTCTLLSLADTSCTPNAHGCAYIALCPTMRVPQDATWDREVVYNTMWALLVELEKHNRQAVASGSRESSISNVHDGISGGASDGTLTKELHSESPCTPIRTVLMTGFGTGTGKLSAARCAQQMALAVEHFADACAHPRKWSALEWDDAFSYADEVKLTHTL